MTATHSPKKDLSVQYDSDQISTTPWTSVKRRMPDLGWCWEQADDPGAVHGRGEKVPFRRVFVVLTIMKETAEAYLRTKGDDAVVTVLACFNDSQRAPWIALAFPG